MRKLAKLDGNEIGQGEFVLYMYGPDAEKLFVAVEPILRSAYFSFGGPRLSTPEARQVQLQDKLR